MTFSLGFDIDINIRLDSSRQSVNVFRIEELLNGGHVVVSQESQFDPQAKSWVVTPPGTPVGFS